MFEFIVYIWKPRYLFSSGEKKKPELPEEVIDSRPGAKKI